jgi:adenine phosphoribosyltransferase
MELESYIRHIPGFPRDGILFHDITPLLQDAAALRYSVDRMAAFGRGRGVDLILGAEARGFILGAALAYSGGRLRRRPQARQAASQGQPLRVRPGVRH